MSELYKENGFLSEYGEHIFKEILDDKITTLLKEGHTEEEIRLIGSIIQQRVRIAVSNFVQTNRDLRKNLSNMSDDDFYCFLNAKYNSNWTPIKLTPEELDRYSNFTKKDTP